ncbi:MAG: TerC family protein [Terriglobales bacterium]
MLLFWILFNLFVLAMLALDLGVVNRRPHRIGVRQALAWSGLWIALAAAFAVLIFLWQGRPQALQFVTGYVIELSLSVDNLFVFLVVFRYFKVPDEYQHKVLSWGIFGALLMRGAFIAAGVGLIQRFSWITYAFGALLVYSGLKLLGQGKTKIHPDKNLALRLFRRVLPVTEDYVNGQFFTRRFSAQGLFAPTNALYATPLLVVLLVVETTDILFAVDSVPAVLAITLNPFIVYTSNVLAILGLRSMYFALAGIIDRFRYLHYGLSLVLVLIGLKMLASHYVTIPTEWALAIVLSVLGVSIVASMVDRRKKAP